MFASHSQANEFHVHFQLTNLTQGAQPITKYFAKVQSLPNTLAATSNPLSDKEFVTFLLIGLRFAYESFIISVTTQAEPISSLELYQLLLVHESQMSHIIRNTSFPVEPIAHFSTAGEHHQWGWGFFRGGQQGPSGRGHSTSSSHGGRNLSSTSPTYSQQSLSPHPTCQVCNKTGHVALQCWYRFDHSYQSEAPSSFSTNYTTPSSFSNATCIPIPLQPTISLMTWITSTYLPSNAMVVTKFECIMSQICQSNILVTPLFSLNLLLSFYIICYMCLQSQKIWFQFVSSMLITLVSLSFTLLTFLLRTKWLGRSSLLDQLVMAFMSSHLRCLLLRLLQPISVNALRLLNGIAN